jgi:Na+-transporting NADH:ubiquinone oxidoreductase subunit B
VKFLRNTLDKVHPLFDKGGKLEKAYPLYEALDTFLYTPGQVTKGLTHLRDSLDLKRMMTMVIVALIPCIFMACWNTGYQANIAIERMTADGIDVTYDWHNSVQSWLGLGHSSASFLDNFMYGLIHFLPIYVVCMTFGGTAELIFSVIRRHEINEGFLVSGMLFPLILPPNIPLYQVAIGIVVGIVLAKEIFGGTGRNFLNPAMTARAILYFNFPQQISGSDVWTAVDGYSGATALGAVAIADPAVGMSAMNNIPVTGGIFDYSWWSSFIGTIPGSMGETSALAAIFGAVVLIMTGIGSWKIMAGSVVGAVGLSGVFYLFSSGTENSMMLMPPWWHLVIGGFAFGTVFMATDPVSSSMTEVGKWLYGILIGVMTILIRVVNPAYPEGIMLAVLFANVFAPVIDYGVMQWNVSRRAARYAA